MKNFSLILNLLLLAAVGFLFYKVYSNNKPATPSMRNMNRDSLTATRPFRIAYFEMDSVQENTDMVKDVMDELNKHKEKNTDIINQMVRKLEEKKSAYGAKQDKMTQEELQNAMMDVGRDENAIGQKRQSLDQDYAEIITQKQMAMRKAVQEFVAEYNKSFSYTYIIADEPGFLYYKDSAFNITSEVIKGLNDKYRAEKKK